jgi:hypothetical protein
MALYIVKPKKKEGQSWVGCGCSKCRTLAEEAEKGPVEATLYEVKEDSTIYEVFIDGKILETFNDVEWEFTLADKKLALALKAFGTI